MARGVGTYSAGTIPSGTGNRDTFVAKIVELLTDYQTNGEDAWELADLISSAPSTYEAVFHSVGDKTLGSGVNEGDTDIWVKVLQDSGGDNITFLVYQDYSPTSHTGYRVAGDAPCIQTLSDTVAIDWWCVVNEYEMVMVFYQGGTWFSFIFGQPIRPYGALTNGVARSTSQSGTGDGVVFGLDRDISAAIQVGQYVWLVNQTPDATSLQSVGIDLCEVTAISSNSITVDGVTNTYANGSLIGIDPAAVYTKAALQTAIPQFTSTMDGSYSGALAQDSTFVNPGGALVTEGDFDPGPDQVYVGFQPVIKMTSHVPAGFRGKIQHLRVFTVGLQTDGDVMQIDFDSGQQWKCFVAETSFSGWATAIGPGAS